MSGTHSPTDHPFVKLAYEGAKRIIVASENGKRAKRKEPISIEMMKIIVNSFKFTHNLVDIRFVVMSLLGFAGFLRISELLEIKTKEITFTDQGVKIFLPKSKADQLREGNVVCISKTGNETCPVKWLKNYLHSTGLISEPDSFIFCRLWKTKFGHTAKGQYRISYATARDNFRERLKKMFPDYKNYGLHSLRSGGATAAADNGIGDRLISQHGRWSSVSSRNKYIKDKHSRRFEISRSLGL